MADDKSKNTKTFRVNDESLNCYGFWVSSAGLDVSDFLQSPVMLWNHLRGWRGTEDEILPIGIWENLRQEKGEWLAEPKFDMEDSFAAKIGGKVERGILRACSIGIVALEWSEDPALMKPGQTRATVTKSKLREISITDIPANKRAVALYDADGKQINLSDTGDECPVPLINRSKSQSDTMSDLKIIALRVGLPENSDSETVQAKIKELQEKASKADVLQAKLDGLEAAQKAARKTEAETLLNDATAAGKITADQRAAYAKLFDADHESAKTVLAGLPAPTKLSDVGKPGGSPGAPGATYNGKTFAQLSKDEPQVLADLKDSDPATFKALFKAQYGKDYKG